MRNSKLFPKSFRLQTHCIHSSPLRQGGINSPIFYKANFTERVDTHCVASSGWFLKQVFNKN